MGAALASAISVIVGSIMIVVYIVGFSKVLHLYRPKFSIKKYLIDNPQYRIHGKAWFFRILN